MEAVLDKLFNLIKKNPQEIYLVGGAVRDLFLNRKIKDFDFVLKNNVEEISRGLAGMIDGTLVVLDQKRGVYRVIKGDGIYDFSRMKGDSIEEDLIKRDFTINAMGIPFNEYNLSIIKSVIREKNNLDKKECTSSCKSLIDPFAGKEDIKQRTLKLVSENVIQDDPLRILRGVRFKEGLSLEVDPLTETLMKNNREGLEGVAEERIKDELLQIFSLCEIKKTVTYMEEQLELLSFFFSELNGLKEIGQCKYHDEDVWTHSKLLLWVLEELRRDSDLKQYINIDEVPLLRWSALFHDIGKLETERKINGKTHFRGHAKTGSKIMVQKMSKFKFSNKAIYYVKTLIRYHMRPLALYCQEGVTSKAFYRFFTAAGELTPLVCILSAADVISTRKVNNGEGKTQSYLEYIKIIINKYENMERN